MKCPRFLILLLFIPLFFSSCEKDKAIPAPVDNARAVCPGNCQHIAQTFSLDDSGYLLTGNGELWAYDGNTNSWTQKSAFPGIRAFSDTPPAVFYNGHSAYLVSGYGDNFSPVNPAMISSFQTWRYDSTTDTWTRLSDFPGSSSANVAFGMNGKAWLMSCSFYANTTKEVWEYDIATDSWTRKTDYPFSVQKNPVAFAENSKGYCGCGIRSGNDPAEFWEYDPTNDAWIAKCPYPGVARGTQCLPVGAKAYVGPGWSGHARTTDVYYYDQSTNSWIRTSDYDGPHSSTMLGFVSRGELYYKTVSDGGLWHYLPN